uniref:hypothetical protein n=1 Tax=Nonlabens sp. Ci31 TaxID=2608253 RepID=UPI0014747EBF|nr:hypothetical protein [Nonlabens sp. Ci31]
MNIPLTTISITREDHKLSTTEASQLLIKIVSIPDSIPFEERLIKLVLSEIHK